MAYKDRKYAVKEIRDLNPCFDPTEIEGITEESTITLLEILDLPIKDADKLLIASKLLDDKTNRLFACWCAVETLKLVKDPDPRSIKAVEVSINYALGKATEDELRNYYTAVYARDRATYATYAAAYAAYVANASDASRTATQAAIIYAGGTSIVACNVRKAQVNQLKKMIGGK